MKLLLAIFTIKLLPFHSFIKQLRIFLTPFIHSAFNISILKIAASHALQNLINSSKQFHFYLLAELIRLILSFFLVSGLNILVVDNFCCFQVQYNYSKRKTFVFEVVSRRLNEKMLNFCK